MREIKFRAWTKKNEMQYNVVPFQWDYVIDRMWHRCIESNGNGILGSGGTEAKFEVGGFAIEEGNLMQYTGLKDKNGIEIFEGDIVQYAKEYPICPKCPERDEILSYGYCPHCGSKIEKKDNIIIAEVDFQHSRWNFTHEYCECPSLGIIKNTKIIGNKFENPELLKQES